MSMADHAALPVTAVLAAVPVRDPEVAQTFYERLLGTLPTDSPMPGLSQWDLGGAVLQVVVDDERSGGGLVTLVFDDLATAADAIRGRGIDLDVTQGEVVTAVAQVLDPDGNAITLVQS
jgi:glyoxylase I family protein